MVIYLLGTSSTILLVKIKISLDIAKLRLGVITITGQLTFLPQTRSTEFSNILKTKTQMEQWEKPQWLEDAFFHFAHKCKSVMSVHTNLILAPFIWSRNWTLGRWGQYVFFSFYPYAKRWPGKSSLVSLSVSVNEPGDWCSALRTRGTIHYTQVTQQHCFCSMNSTYSVIMMAPL